MPKYKNQNKCDDSWEESKQKEPSRQNMRPADTSKPNTNQLKNAHYEHSQESLEDWIQKFGCGDSNEGFNQNSSAKTQELQTYKFNEIYNGEMVGGTRHGHGTYHYRNGDIYEGQWCQGRRHGIGKLTHSDGSYHIGEYRSGVKQGYGKETIVGK